MKKSILFISYNGMTDPLGQSQVLPYLMELVKAGFNITVLSVEKKERLEREGDFISGLMQRSGLKWMPIIFHKSIPVIAKMYDRYMLLKTAKRLYRKEKFDIIHCRSYVASEIGLALKRKFGVPFIFDMRGFWADEKKDGNHWPVSNPVYRQIYRHYKKLEKELLIHADAVVVLTHAAKKEISSWELYKPVADKIEVIPCCADLVHFSEAKIDHQLKAKLGEELKLKDSHPVLCYLGSIGEVYAVDEMLFFFNELKTSYPSAKFLFFTKDDPALVTSKLGNFPNISVADIAVRFVSRENLPTHLALCDFSLFFYRPTYSRIACSPTKFAEISGLGMPVICNVVGDLNKEFLEGLPHVVIENLEEKTISESVPFVRSFDQADKTAVRNFVLERYDLNDGVAKYQTIYQLISV